MLNFKKIIEIAGENDLSFLNSLNDLLIRNSFEKIGIYFRSISPTLLLFKSNIPNIPKKIIPTDSLEKYAKKYCDGVFLMNKDPYFFYLLGENFSNLSGVVLLNSMSEDKTFWGTLSIILRLYTEIRIEKIKASIDANIICWDEKIYPVKGKISYNLKNIKQEDIDKRIIFHEGLKITLKELKIPLSLPGELFYYFQTEEKKSKGFLDINDSLMRIKKYADSLKNDIDRESPYFAEISTISELTSRLLEDY